jgi:sulfur carrier protein
MKVNGDVCVLGAPINLMQFLDTRGFDGDAVAVERNGDIVPRAAYETLILAETDSLEILHFVGGG